LRKEVEEKEVLPCRAVRDNLLPGKCSKAPEAATVPVLVKEEHDPNV